MSTLNAKVILNIKTAAEWANSMEILLEGELGIESDTRLIKIGNGVDTYISLPYTAASDINDIEGVTVTSPTDGNVLTYSNGEWVNITPSSLPADTDLSHYDNTTSGFITFADIPALPADTDLSHYDNTNSDFATVSQIPTDVSQLNNDAGYITSASIPSVGDGTITIQKNSVNVDSFTTNQNTNKTINITVPTLLSELSNDVGYITSATLPTVNDATLTIQRNGTTVGTFTANAATNSTINISVPTSFSDITSAGDLLPSIDTAYNLGSSSYRWNTLYVCNIYGGGSSIEIDGNVYPKTDVTDALGGSSNRWREIYGKELYIDQVNASSGNTSVSFSATVLPKTGDTYSLGGSSYKWSSIHATNINLSTLNPYYIDANNTYVTLKNNNTTVAYLGQYNSISGIFPANDGLNGGTECLGQDTKYWYAGYFANVYCAYVTSTKLSVSGLSDSYKVEYSYADNGHTAYIRWQNTSNVWHGVKGNDTSFYPAVSTMTLGDSSNKWSDGWFSGRLYSDSAQVHTVGTGGGVGGGSSATDFYITTNANSSVNDVKWTYQGGSFYPGDSNRIGYGIGLQTSGHIIGTVYAQNFTQVSDAIVKENIRSLTNSLPILLGINPVSFDYIDSKKHTCGFIAQEVEQVFEDAVCMPPDTKEQNGVYAIDYNALLALAVGAIQELSSKVDELNAKLKKAGL